MPKGFRYLSAVHDRYCHHLFWGRKSNTMDTPPARTPSATPAAWMVRPFIFRPDQGDIYINAEFTSAAFGQASRCAWTPKAGQRTMSPSVGSGAATSSDTPTIMPPWKENCRIEPMPKASITDQLMLLWTWATHPGSPVPCTTRYPTKRRRTNHHVSSTTIPSVKNCRVPAGSWSTHTLFSRS